MRIPVFILDMSDMESKPPYRRLKRLTLPSSMSTVLAAPWKNGWFPDQTSTVYDFCVPLVVRTSSPLQKTCDAVTAPDQSDKPP